MLSNISMLVLGLIKEKPLNAYEIVKILDKIKVQYWLNVAPSSIYATIKKLNEKNYIVGRIEKDGNMPDKTIYGITDSGNEIFIKNLIEYLKDTKLDINKFNVSNLFICHLDKNLVVDILNEKYEKLDRVFTETINSIELIKSQGLIGKHALAVLNHNKNLIDAELKTTKELIYEIIKDKDWDTFIISSSHSKEI